MFEAGQKVILSGPSNREEKINFICGWAEGMEPWIGKEAILQYPLRKGAAFNVVLAENANDLYPCTWNWDARYMHSAEPAPESMSKDEFLDLIFG